MREISIKSKIVPDCVIQVDDEDYDDLTSRTIFIQHKDGTNYATLYVENKRTTLSRHLLREKISAGDKIMYKDKNPLNNQKENLKIQYKKVITIEDKLKVKTSQKKLPVNLRTPVVDKIMKKLHKDKPLTTGEYFQQIKKFSQTVLLIRHIETNIMSLFSYWFQITKEDGCYYLAMNDALPTSELLFYANHLMNYSWSICDIYLDITACFWEEYNENGESIKFEQEKDYKKVLTLV